MQDEANPYLDRARYGLYPPGSTFKVVTAMAALRKDAQLAHKTYQCDRLPDGRVGNFLKGSKRPIRDDVQDKTPHGTLDLEHGLVVSCNAYFAQLGTYDVGAEALHDTATLLGIAAAIAGHGGGVEEVAAAIGVRAGRGGGVAVPDGARGGHGGEWRRHAAGPLDRRTRTTDASRRLPRYCRPESAATLGRFMREVVTAGTGRRGAASVPVAGKTGTAELAGRAVARLVHRLRAVRRGGAQDRVLGAGGEWSVRRHGGRSGGGGDGERGSEAGPDSAGPSNESFFGNREDHRARISPLGPSACSGRPIPTSCCWCIARFWRRSKARCRWWRRGRRVFPFAHVVVTLVAAEAERRTILQAAFGERLGADIREALEGSECELPRGFSVEVRTAEAGLGAFEIAYVDGARESRPGARRHWPRDRGQGQDAEPGVCAAQMPGPTSAACPN